MRFSTSVVSSQLRAPTTAWTGFLRIFETVSNTFQSRELTSPQLRFVSAFDPDVPFNILSQNLSGGILNIINYTGKLEKQIFCSYKNYRVKISF